MSNTATICPKDYCRALIPATGEDRTAHLTGHASDEKAARAIRTELLAIRELVAEMKETNREVLAEIRTTRTQAPAEALVIEEWPEDELPDDDLDTEEEDDLEPDGITNAEQQPEQTYEYPLAIDRDDDLDARLANATGAQPTI